VCGGQILRGSATCPRAAATRYGQRVIAETQRPLVKLPWALLVAVVGSLTIVLLFTWLGSLDHSCGDRARALDAARQNPADPALRAAVERSYCN
jgi:hypothetical protein